ncbi:MAG TPA: hypothetical protein PLF52_04700, partial [Syntrophales bacterium]|nr:hypothetical protein [Syntrophales bacterium]
SGLSKKTDKKRCPADAGQTRPGEKRKGLTSRMDIRVIYGSFKAVDFPAGDFTTYRKIMLVSLKYGYPDD